MRSGRRIGLVALVAIAAAGCWPFKGKRKSATPEPVLSNSPRTVDSLWLAGQRAFNKGQWGEANKVFTRLGTAMPVTDPRMTRLNFFKGEIDLALGNELDAVRQFRRIADEAPDDSLAADALLRAGDAYSYLWKRAELDPTYGHTAMGVYQEIQSRYPNSPASRRAVGRVQDLNDRLARKEYLSAVFYYKFKAYESAILMLRSVVAQYPRAPVVPEALEKLVLSYKALGYQEDIKETCGYITRFFPGKAGLVRLCPPATAGADSVGKG